MAQSFGERLRDLRNRAGLSQEALATKSTVSPSSIRGFETGKRNNPRIGTLRLLATALELTADERTEFVAFAAQGAEFDGADTGPDSGRSPGFRPVQLAGDVVDVIEEIANEMASRCESQHQHQQVSHPFPLAVRWTPADGELSDHRSNITASPDGTTSAHVDLTGQFGTIADLYRQLTRGRLVVLGEAGSGKTTLVRRLVLDLLGTRAHADRVPVIVEVGSWNPANQDLAEWLAGQLIQHFPSLAATRADGRTMARTLVDLRRVLPVLDGFDEIAPGLRRQALRKLRFDLRPLVLTSRPEDYRRAVADTDVLSAAAVVQLDTLTAADLIDYLPWSTGKARLWAPVKDELDRTPLGVAGRNIEAALRTPLMVWLARCVYGDRTGSDPAELLDTERFPDSHAIERHLVASYVPTAYRDLDPENDDAAAQFERVRRWLRYLARHAQHPDTTDIAWWQLGATMRLWVRSLVVGLTVVPVIVLIAVVIHLLPGTGSYAFVSSQALVAGATGGLLLGLAYALVRLKRSTVPGPTHVRLRIRRPAGWPFARLRSRVLVGALCGLVFGAGLGLLTAFSLAEKGIADLSPRSIGFDIAVWGTTWALAAAVSIAIVSWFETPADTGSAASPKDFLHANRATVTSQLLLGGLVAGLIVGLGFVPVAHGGLVLLNQFVSGSGEGAGVYVGPLVWLQLGIGGGAGSALAFAVTLTAWGQWVILARWWLPLTGQLPWNVVAFLDDAYRRGVLRQSGPTYQFRHDLLQAHLADTEPRGHRS